MEDIGRILREAREQLNKSHEEIHDQTKISSAHLQLLEANNFTFLPETYIKAFLKTYAKALGLDEKDILNKYLENQREKRRAEEELNEVSSQDSAAPIPTNYNLEWSLGFGAIILIFGLIFVYAKYKSQNYGEPIPIVKGTLVEEVKDEESPESHRPQDKYEDNVSSPLELEITAIEKVGLRLAIDNNKVNEYTLSPGNKLIWIAEKRFEMFVGNVAAIMINFDGKRLNNLGNPGVAMRLVITKDGLVEQEIISNTQSPKK